MCLVPEGTAPDLEFDEFLRLLSKRLGMLLHGGDLDLRRAAYWFIRWWQLRGSSGSKLAFPEINPSAGWGLDFDWTDDPPTSLKSEPKEKQVVIFEQKMRQRIAAHMEEMRLYHGSESALSDTQKKKRKDEENKAK